MNYNKCVIFDDVKCLSVDSKEEAYCQIMNEYYSYNVSMYDLLAGTSLEGFSMEDVVYIYAKCMKTSDGDTIVHIRDENWIVISDTNAYEILGR